MSHDIAIFPSPNLLIRGKFPAKVKAGKSRSRYCVPKASWGQEAGWRGETLRTPSEGKAQVWIEAFLDRGEFKRERYYEWEILPLSLFFLTHSVLDMLCKNTGFVSSAARGTACFMIHEPQKQPLLLKFGLKKKKKVLKKAWQLFFLLP